MNLEIPELFRGLPEAVFLSPKLFSVETQKTANRALHICTSCKKKVFVQSGEPAIGKAFVFEVGCKTCMKSYLGDPLSAEEAESMESIMQSLQDVVSCWNELNRRKPAKASLKADTVPGEPRDG